MTKIGLITVGQAPRSDVVPDMAAILGGDVEIVEAGALDGLGHDQIAPLAPEGDDEILRACAIVEKPATETAPKFDFDSSDLTQAERDVLAQVAKCLTTGPLKGRSVQLVGRADPRGETEYNMTLGGKRANAVHGFMSQLGVDKAKMKETSRGELDSSGTDEDGWRRDRRVDLRLIP